MPKGVSTKIPVLCAYCRYPFRNRYNRLRHEKECKKLCGADLQAQYDTGLSLSQIARQYGVTVKFVCFFVKKTRRNVVATKLWFSHSGYRPYGKGVSRGEKVFSEYLHNFGLCDKFEIVQEMVCAGYRLDFAFPGIKLDVEIDGRQHYRSMEAKAHDQNRNARLTNLGWTIYRIDSRDFLARQQFVFDEFMKFFLAAFVTGTLPTQVTYQSRITDGGEKFVKDRKFIISQSGIDLKARGWSVKLGKLLQISPESALRWVKSNMPEAYCRLRMEPVMTSVVRI